MAERYRLAAEERVGQTLRQGELRVHRLLGLGGMGAVYEVEELRTGTRRALKVLHFSHVHDSVMCRRFFGEATVAAREGGGAVVSCHDDGFLADGSPYLLMELLEGSALSAHLAAGPPPLEFVRHVGEQAARAFAEVHGAGIVHRDIKPDNLFLEGDRERPRVRLIDFGIAKIAGTSNDPTALGTVLGTPHYMAPEQALGRTEMIDPRTDIYGLGASLYRCLTGRVPFDGHSLMAVVFAIHRGERPPVRELRPDVPPVFEAIVDRAMQRDPARRFPSMRSLAGALGALAPASRAAPASRTAAARVRTACGLPPGGGAH